MKISSINEDVIWHKWHKFYKVSLLHAKMVRVWFQKMLFLSEHAAVYVYRSKSCLQILKTTEYRVMQSLLFVSLSFWWFMDAFTDVDQTYVVGKGEDDPLETRSD